MREEYDFSQSRKNPHVGKLKRQISIRLDIDTIEYFKHLAEETGVPYQNLINTYLAYCASQKLKPHFVWESRQE